MHGMIRSKLTAILVIAVAIAVSMALSACGASSSPSSASGSGGTGSYGNDSAAASPSSTPASSSASPRSGKGVWINLSSTSVLTFDNDPASAQLVADMENGRIPTSCTVRYDQMGALPTVTATDERSIREVYKRLARMHVGSEPGMGVTDSYHLVSFELQDGTVTSFNFEGVGTLVRGKTSYSVSDDGGLWEYVQFMQKRYLRDQSAGEDYLPITLEDADELVIDCPSSAAAGEPVRVLVPDVLDANLHVSVNGSESFGTLIYGEAYEFIMPNEPVTVRVWVSSDGIAGS